jgi:acyl carrier protein
VIDESFRQRITAIAVQCLDDEELQHEIPLEDLSEVKLLGSRAICDSLGLVSYVVALEGQINDRFDTQIALMSERAMSQERSPFRNLEALIDYAMVLLDEQFENSQ